MANISNDNDACPPSASPSVPDAHGQAALLLVESLMHGLVERSVITVADAVEIVDAAADVKAEIAVDLGEPEETEDRALNLLSAISQSLKLDAQAL